MSFFTRPPQSTAVKISKPTSQDDSADARPPPSRTAAVQRQCRNIVIFGSCKFQDKGCKYYHPPPPDAPQPIVQADSPATATLTPQAVNASVFVPKSTATHSAASSPPTSYSRPASVASPAPAPSSPAPPQADYPEQYQSQDDYAYQAAQNQVEGLTHQMETLDTQYYQQQYVDGQSQYDEQSQYADEQHYADEHQRYAEEHQQYPVDPQHYAGYPQYDDAMDFYSAPPVYMRQPLDYHLYTPAIPQEYLASQGNTHFFPDSNELRQILQKRSETIRGVAPPGFNLPEELSGYHTLVPLEPIGPGVERRKIGNWHTTVYRAIRASDGIPFALRRVENYRLTQSAAFGPIGLWSSIRHPGIVPVREAFTTRSFDDYSLFVVYQYFPNAQTLFDAHIKNKGPTFQQHGRSQILVQNSAKMIPERTMWSYIIQIASAIKKVHETRLAVRMIDSTKILLTGQNRIRIGSCGIIDVLAHDTPQDLQSLQQDDLTMFGRLIFTLCCNNVAASSAVNFQKSLEYMNSMYSQDIKTIALFLISKGSPHRSIDHVLEMLRGRVLAEQEEALMANDRLENELLSELENARLVRLLCKFGFINERPEFARDPRWSETGDRYIVKLFRDYVFHQVDDHGKPVLNLSHVLTCLNKLDAGTDEKMMLVARDEQSCLVVTYKEVKSCIESAFNDLARPPAAAIVPKSQVGYTGR